MSRAKYCRTYADVPTTDHYAIIGFSTIDVPGDERSRTNPGHGYPASVEHIAIYIAYALEDRVEWEADIKQRITRLEKFIAIKATRANITANVEVRV